MHPSKRKKCLYQTQWIRPWKYKIILTEKYCIGVYWYILHRVRLSWSTLLGVFLLFLFSCYGFFFLCIWPHNNLKQILWIKLQGCKKWSCLQQSITNIREYREFNNTNSSRGHYYCCSCTSSCTSITKSRRQINLIADLSIFLSEIGLSKMKVFVTFQKLKHVGF